jgi:hypothetical protein
VGDTVEGKGVSQEGGEGQRMPSRRYSTSLVDMEKRKSVPLPRIQSRFLGRPAHSLVAIPEVSILNGLLFVSCIVFRNPAFILVVQGSPHKFALYRMC